MLVVLFLIGIGIYSYRKSISDNKTIVPRNLHVLLLSNVLFYEKLKEEDRQEFRNKIELFLKAVNVESVGFRLEDIDVVLVAASAVIPVFYFENWQYSNLSTVILYPDYFNKDLSFTEGDVDRNIGGLVGTGRFRHQMILSRKALHYGFNNKTDKSNTGIHEFVHLIDMLDGDVDGVPNRLLSNAYVIPWLDLIHKEMEAINNDESDIRAYGGTKQEEFFAVASEYFFERPDLLKRKHPELFKMMELCFCSKR